MYNVFDNFCQIPTWDTCHPADRARFEAALAEVLAHPGFSPDEMGQYILQNHAEPIWPKDKAQIEKVVSELVAEARQQIQLRTPGSL